MKKLLNKKGMTLVEVIVVLVILAILAAILVPSMIGWINKANEKTMLAEARTLLLAAQTIVSENYADTSVLDGTTPYTAKDTEIKALAELPDAAVISITVTKGKVTGVTYTKDGKIATYSSATSNWTITDVK